MFLLGDFVKNIVVHVYIYNRFLAGMKNYMQINIRHPPPEVFLEVFFVGGLDINFKYWDV